jgi:hypothetical protein
MQRFQRRRLVRMEVLISRVPTSQPCLKAEPLSLRFEKRIQIRKAHAARTHALSPIGVSRDRGGEMTT